MKLDPPLKEIRKFVVCKLGNLWQIRSMGFRKDIGEFDIQIGDLFRSRTAAVKSAKIITDKLSKGMLDDIQIEIIDK